MSELLAGRGVPLPTVGGVSAVDGEKPAEKVDWDCALSTVDDPKVSFFFSIVDVVSHPFSLYIKHVYNINVLLLCFIYN